MSIREMLGVAKMCILPPCRRGELASICKEHLAIVRILDNHIKHLSYYNLPLQHKEVVECLKSAQTKHEIIVEILKENDENE